MYEIWYKLQPRTFSIYEVEVAKSSDSSVWIVQRALFEGQEDILKAVKRETSHEIFFKNQKDALIAQEELIDEEIRRLEEELKELKENGGYYFKFKEYQKVKFNPELLL